MEQIRSQGTPHSKVAIVYTKPESVLSDVGKAMHLAGYQSSLSKNTPTLLKINISWQRWYPACSTTPWQLEGVVKTLQADDYKEIIAVQNGTVVVNPYVADAANKHKNVRERYRLPTLWVDVPPSKWIKYEPKGSLLVLNKVYPEGITIPEAFLGKNIIHLPTVKTHVFTTNTGAMKNAFGGLLNRRRHWTHSVIHETLVDLLMIQKEIHPGLFAVMDGTFAGDGPGPRAMRWHAKNVLLASADQVAIDAVAAKLMGFDPMSLKYIRLAHERGLGCGKITDIEIVGEDISNVNWRFTSRENTFASMGQKLIYHGPLKFLERMLLRSPLVPWSYMASNVYHNWYWFNLYGRRRVRKALATDWGKLFQEY